MSDTEAGLDAPPFDSLDDLRRAHLELARATRKERSSERRGAPIAAMRAFLRRAQATGRALVTADERDTAQSLLDYWSAELISAGDTAMRDSAAWLLDPPDHSADPDLVDKPFPYQGLGSFQPNDRDRLLGRDAEVEELVGKVRANLVTVVAGPSGAGKTSLVLAGLAPRLTEVQVDGGPAMHLLDVVLPGADPLAALARALDPAVAASAAALAARRKRLLSHPDRAAEWLDPQTPALLVVDQVEELFTMGADAATQQAAGQALAALGEPHRVVLIARPEFLDKLRSLPGLDKLLAGPATVFTATPMTANELRRVIMRPADDIGLRFDDGLVDDLVKEVQRDPTGLLLLQFTLQRMWDRRDRNRITWAAYDAVGRPHEALHWCAEAAYDSLPEAQQRASRELFLQLVRPGPGDMLYRRRLARDGLPEAAMGVLDVWVATGLIRQLASPGSGDSRFEVTHDALPQYWPRLKQWLQEERSRSEARLRFEAAALAWQKARDSKHYLLRDRQLEEARQYRDSSSAIAALVDASLAARRKGNVILGLSILGLLALFAAVAVVAVWQWFSSEQARQQEAEARALDNENTQLFLARQASTKAELQQALFQVDLNRFKAALQELGVAVPPGLIQFASSTAPPGGDTSGPVGEPAPGPLPARPAANIRRLARSLPDAATTASPATVPPTAASPTTAPPTTAPPTTAPPTTAPPPTASPTTASPTTAPPTTASPAAALPTTAPPLPAPQPAAPQPPAPSPNAPVLAGLVAGASTVTTPYAQAPPAAQADGSSPGCEGAIWLGPAGENILDAPPLTGADWKDHVFSIAAALRLREGFPDANNHNQEMIQLLPKGTAVIARDNPVMFTPPGHVPQYWLSVRVPDRVCATVYIQFTGASGDVADQLRSALMQLGYTVPMPESLRSAAGLHEVRYYYPDDERTARTLAIAARRPLSSLDGGAAPPIKLRSMIDWPRTKPPEGTLELWLDLSQAAGG